MALHNYPMFDESQMPLLFEDEPRVVFVDTDFNTHLAILVSPLMSFADLKKQIALDHFKSFPTHGRRMVNKLLVRVLGVTYLIPDSMLVKEAFYGMKNSWILRAETCVATGPFETPELPNPAEFNHVKPIHQELKLNHVEPSYQHHYADQHLQPLYWNHYGHQHVQPPYSHNHECQHGKPSHLNQSYKTMETPNTNQPTNQSSKALILKETPDMSDKKKKESKKRKDMDYIGGKTDALLKTVPQDRKGEDTGAKHDNGSGVGQHVTFFVLKGGASENIVTDERGNSTNLAENLNKESEIVSFESPAEPLAKKSKKKKDSGIDGVTQNHPATSVTGLAGDLPSNNGTIIHKSEQKDDNTNLAENLNKESEINFESQHGAQAKKSKKKKSGVDGATQNLPATSVKGVAGDAPSNTGTTIYESEQKGNKTEQGSRETAENVLPSHVNNVPELLTQQESLNLSEKENKIVDDVAPVNSENTAKKRRTNKAKSSSMEDRDLSSRRPDNDENVDGTKHIGEHLQPDDVGRLDVSVEIVSGKLKKSRNKKVPENPQFPVKEPDEEIKVDDTLTKCDNNDALFKSENDAKVCKTDGTDKECRRTADFVSQSLLDDISKVALSQDEPLNMVEKEKEIKEVVAPSKSENTAKRRKSKTKSCGADNQDWSSRRDDGDEKADGSRQTCIEFCQSDDIGGIEEKLETLSGKVKKSRSQKDVPLKDPCGSLVQDQPDEEKAREDAVPISVIQSDQPKKTRKKQPVLGKDLPVDQQLDEKLVDMEAPDRVEQVVDSYHQKKVIQSEGHEYKASEIPPLEVSSGSAHPGKPRASKQKAKKLDQPLSMDISSSGNNLSVSKKNRGNVEISNEQVNVASVIHASVDDGNKVSGANLATEIKAPESAEELLTDSKSSDFQNQKALKVGEEHAILDEVLQLEKPLASKKKTKKLDQPSSIDTSSSRHLVGLKKNEGSAKTSEVQISNSVRKHKKVIGSDIKASEASSVIAGNKARNIYQEAKAEKPLNSLEEDGLSHRRSSRLSSKEVLDASAQKKGWLASSRAIFEDGNSSSSDDGDQSYALSFSTTDDSNHSEVESGGVVKSRHDSSKDHASIKADRSSGMKLESILKSSSRYKKAKLVASQSQGESEPPDFVPDSQGYM